MRTLSCLFAGIMMLATPMRADQVQNFVDDATRFYLRPGKERFDKLQSDGNRFADVLRKKGNGADLLVAVMIAKISTKYHWQILGKGKISAMSREITERTSSLAKYVANDAKVNPSRLDIWWVSFFATGEEQYLGKILRYADIPRGGTLADMVIKGAAAWSFKSNCKQHKAVAGFARECLSSNAFPEKREFLKECIAYADNGSARH